MEQLIKVIILEDNPADAKLIQHKLTKMPYTFEFKVIEDQQSFILEIIGNTPNLILADNNLPSFDGEEALLLSRKVCPEVPFIFVTGTIRGEKNAASTILKGASGFVSKNNLDDLIDIVEETLYRNGRINTIEYAFFLRSLRSGIKYIEAIDEMVHENAGLIDLKSLEKIKQALKLLKSIDDNVELLKKK